MKVTRHEAHLEQVLGQVLRHLLRQRRHEHPLVTIDPHADLVHQIVDLVARLEHVPLPNPDHARPRPPFTKPPIRLRPPRPPTAGSTTPVGRTICSTPRPERVRSYSPGVADTNISCGVIDRNSSNVCGRSSRALGSLNP